MAGNGSSSIFVGLGVIAIGVILFLSTDYYGSIGLVVYGIFLFFKALINNSGDTSEVNETNEYIRKAQEEANFARMKKMEELAKTKVKVNNENSLESV